MGHIQPECNGFLMYLLVRLLTIRSIFGLLKTVVGAFQMIYGYCGTTQSRLYYFLLSSPTTES